ncbi:epoxide hydrolase N-terminal domain-containing protein [Nocardia sp. IFM 10818]
MICVTVSPVPARPVRCPAPARGGTTAAYWADGFDWRAHEAELNASPHFVTELDGQTIHFLHLHSTESNALSAGLADSPIPQLATDTVARKAVVSMIRPRGQPCSRTARMAPATERAAAF